MVRKFNVTLSPKVRKEQKDVENIPSDSHEVQYGICWKGNLVCLARGFTPSIFMKTQKNDS